MAHRSFSQLSAYTRCAKQYELTRIHKAPEVPAWFLVGGKAFHAAIEYVNYGGNLFADNELELVPERDFAFTATVNDIWHFFWDQEFQDAVLKTDVPQELWRSAGRKTKDKPNGEDGEWWCSVGPEMIWNYAVWLGGMEEQGWEIAELPDGRMAIEPEFNTLLGDVPVKAFIDVAFAKGEDVLVVDAKTGSKPDTSAQLGLYACSLERTWPHFRPSHGAYYMARTGEATAPASLDRYTLEMYTEQFAQLDRAVKAEIFLPNLGRNCSYCSVNRYCEAYGGDLAAGFDPLSNVTSHQEVRA